MKGMAKASPCTKTSENNSSEVSPYSECNKMYNYIVSCKKTKVILGNNFRRRKRDSLTKILMIKENHLTALRIQ